ncbi:DUF2935 domain-containing protein [Anaerobacillus sp. MEB173]|uniref:DUF2935 domain-containing protein n=1 Tax=Anaerobacillus sp. MEB173 TaxID=3383345 RepID=UPI003F924133
MYRNDFNKTALFEHRFWLQVLGDHSRFILDTLSPNEKKEIERAEQFKHTFDTLLAKSRKNLSTDQILQLTDEAHQQAELIRQYKLDLIGQHLVGDITIELPPTFLNHMVNEVEEYLLVLPYLSQKEFPPVCHPLHYHLVWLLDAAGHADGISGSLDLTEKQIREKSDTFTEHFEQFYIKAVEMAGYLRANIETFPALHRFNNDVELEIILFKKFLAELEELEMNNKLLGTFSALMADHMSREECYYLMKLAQVTPDVNYPQCDPTKPRTE